MSEVLDEKLSKLDRYIAIFIDDENEDELQKYAAFIDSRFDDNFGESLEDVEFDDLSSNSKLKDRINDALSHFEGSGSNINLVPLANRREDGFRYAKPGPIIYYKRLKHLSSAIFYGAIGETLRENFSRFGIFLTRSRTIEIETSASQQGRESEANLLHHVPARSALRQLVATNTASMKTSGHRNPRIAILDTGLNIKHPEFSNRHSRKVLLSCRDENLKWSICNKFDQNDVHGTSVASVAAGRNIGVCPNSDLVVCKTISENANGHQQIETADLVDCLNWLLAGPFEGGSVPDSIILAFYSREPLAQIRGQLDKIAKTKKIVCFASVGETNSPCPHPAALPFRLVVSVAGVDDRNVALLNTNYDRPVGQTDPFRYNPNFAAPGVGITYAAPGGLLRNDGVGSSYACAIAAALSAMIFARNTNFTADLVREALQSRVVEGTSGLLTGAGVLTNV